MTAPEIPESDMSLDTAISILCRVHTRDDDIAGFVVEMGARPDFWVGVGSSEYIKAWQVLREHVHLQTEPNVPQP